MNAARGNKDFDNGGSTVAECSGCLSDADSSIRALPSGATSPG